MRRYRGGAAVVPVAREPSGLPWLNPAQGDLPDVNVWVALATAVHPHHQQALSYWKQALEEAGSSPLPSFWFCRTTMLGMVRVLTQQPFLRQAVDLETAYRTYRQYRGLAQTGMVTEPAGCESIVEALLIGKELPARMWTDVWIAALAQATGLRLVTFDKDFGRLGLERCLILPS